MKARNHRWEKNCRELRGPCRGQRWGRVGFAARARVHAGLAVVLVGSDQPARSYAAESTS